MVQFGQFVCQFLGMFALAYVLTAIHGVNHNVSGLLKCGEGYAERNWDNLNISDVAGDIERLKGNHFTRGIAALLLCGLDLFRKFPCNHQAAAVMCKRLCVVTSILSELFPHTLKFETTTIPESVLTELEELLSDCFRFFSRFSRPDYRIFQLVGNEPDEILYQFHNRLPIVINQIASALGQDPKLYKLDPVEKYYFICDKLSSVRKQKSLDEEVAPYAFAGGIVGVEATSRLTDEVRSELNIMKDVVKTLTADTMRMIDSERCIIYQQAFRSVWLRPAKKRLCMLMKDFVEEIKRELASKGTSSREIHVLCHKLIDMLNHGKPLDANDTVSEFAIAKLVRSVSEDETSLLAAIRNINPGVYTPPLKSNSQIFFSSIQESSIEHAITSPGWTSITGPTLSGKTCRLRYVLKKILDKENAVNPTLDAVWVDFEGVRSELDGILRVASQLYFRRCNILSTLEKNLRDLFATLKKGSIVVMDNILFPVEDFMSMRSDSSPFLDLGWQNPEKVGEAHVDAHSQARKNALSWKRFILRICNVCNGFDHLSFVVVSNVHEPLEPTVQLKQKIVISSVPPAIALDMTNHLVPDIKCSTLIPIDPYAIITASNCLTGEMELLVKWAGSLHELRIFADSVRMANIDTEAIRIAKMEAARMAFHRLNRDSKLLSCCLTCHNGNFTMPSVFAVSKDIFCGDIVKFRLAWDNLVDVGWIVHHYELGYKLSSLSSCISPCNAAIEKQFIYDNYVIHWATELVRINEGGAHTPTALDEFARYSVHFRHVFDNILDFKRDSADNHNSESLADKLSRNKRLMRARTQPDMVPVKLKHKHHQKSHMDSKDSIPHLPPDTSVIPEDKKKKKGSLLKFPSVKFMHVDSKIDDSTSIPTQETLDDVHAEATERDAAAIDTNPIPTEKSRKKFSLTHSPSMKASQKSIQSGISCETIDMGSPESEWILEDSRNDQQIMQVSPNVIDKIIEIVAGKIGRILSYHIPAVVGLKISQQIMCDLNPLDGLHYDGAVVDFAEQCLRNELITEGISHIQQIISLFFAPRDTEVHDPPPFAARALLVQGRLFLEEKAYSNAVRAFDAADRILQLEGWSIAEHYERRVLSNYHHEAQTKSAEMAKAEQASDSEGPSVTDEISSQAKTFSKKILNGFRFSK